MGKKTRQHPDNPDLFWCNCCKKYKNQSNFYKTKRGLFYRCKQCVSIKKKRPYNPNRIRSRQHPSNNNLFWCPKCKAYKPRQDFNVSLNRPYGIHCYCKPCTRIIGKVSSEKNRDRIKAYQEAHRKEKQEYDKQYRKENFKQKKATDERWRLNNMERVNELSRARYYRNHEKSKAQHRDFNNRLGDAYVRGIIFRCMKIRNPTEQIVELVKQRILMKRKLNEFKKWRNEVENETSTSR